MQSNDSQSCLKTSLATDPYFHVGVASRTVRFGDMSLLLN
jgi:hypothetical protein